MHPIHDLDVSLLMATTLASKRRAAELVEIVTAFEMIFETVPSETRLIESFQRLVVCGLLTEAEACFALSPEAQKIMASLKKKGDTAERIFMIKEKLAEYTPAAQYAPCVLTPKQVCSAILEQREAARSPVKNLLAPKPKTQEIDYKRNNKWRPGAPSSRTRKD